MLQELLSTHVTGVADVGSWAVASLADIEANMGMVIEGISTTKAAYELAQELGVICLLLKPSTKLFMKMLILRMPFLNS